MLIATIIGLTGIAVYYVSAVGFEMLSISKQYFSAESMEYKQQLLAVGQGLIAGTQGLICSLLSLVPWIVFSVLIGRRLIQMKA